MSKETETLLEAGVKPIMAGNREMKLWLASESYHYISQTGDGHLLGCESETTGSTFPRRSHDICVLR